MSDFGSSAASESSGAANGDFAQASATGDSTMTGISGYASETTHIGSNAYGDFSREPQGPSMSERPGDAPVNSNISSNAYGDFGRVPTGSSMTERPGYAPANPNISTNARGDFGRVPSGPNSSNYVPAMTTNDWSHQQHPTTGGPAYRQPGPIQPDSQNTFQIFVKSFTDNINHIFEVRASDTVEKLKGMIETNIKVAKSQQRLVYSRYNLEDDKKLSDYDICAQSTVQLLGRLKGG